MSLSPFWSASGVALFFLFLCLSLYVTSPFHFFQLVQKSTFLHQSTSLFLPSISHLSALSIEPHISGHQRDQPPHTGTTFHQASQQTHSKPINQCRSSPVVVRTQEGITSIHNGQSRIFALFLPVGHTESAAHSPSSALVLCILREPGQPSGKEAIACICSAFEYPTHVYFLLGRH